MTRASASTDLLRKGDENNRARAMPENGDQPMTRPGIGTPAARADRSAPKKHPARRFFAGTFQHSFHTGADPTGATRPQTQNKASAASFIGSLFQPAPGSAFGTAHPADPGIPSSLSLDILSKTGLCRIDPGGRCANFVPAGSLKQWPSKKPQASNRGGAMPRESEGSIDG